MPRGPKTGRQNCSGCRQKTGGGAAQLQLRYASHNPNTQSTNQPVLPALVLSSMCNRKEVAQILDLAERAATRWEVTYTHFVSPPVAADALAAINQRADMKAVAWGGYPQAERCRVALGKEEVMLPAQEDPSTLDDAVAALDVRGNFMFDPATHRDFLGAIIGTGIVRDRIGVSLPADCSLSTMRCEDGTGRTSTHWLAACCLCCIVEFWAAVT